MLKYYALVLVPLSLAGLAFSQAGPEPKVLPNIVFILADDMGYGDITAYNPTSSIPTPHLDALARGGMMFTDAHSGSAVCTPTRYGLVTGRYCWRSKLKKGVLFPPEDSPLIGPDRLTVAGFLKQQGYATACIGKWHLGIEWARDARGQVDFNEPMQYGPSDTGFDEFFGVAGSLDMIPYVFFHNHEPVQPMTETQPALGFPRYVRKGPKARDFDPGKALDRLTERAVAYIEDHAGKGSPFFLYFAMTAPHKPVWPAERFKGTTNLGPYGDFVHQTDWSVGQVLKALERAGITEKTVVFYSSDNGSYMYRIPPDRLDHLKQESVQGYHTANHQANGIWRGTKADIWEAGHRVPFIVRWPGKIEAGTCCAQTICLTDFMATCAEIVGQALPDHAAEDSFSLMPLMEGRDWPAPRAPVVNHSIDGMFALRDGRWKMVFGNGSGGRERPKGKPFEKPYSLFDLDKDPSETTNLIEEHPKIANDLETRLKAIMDSGRSR